MKPSARSSRASVPSIRAGLSARGRTFGLVVSRFNEPLTRPLLEGAVDTLLAHGARRKDLKIVHVPGAFEAPLAAQQLIRRFRPDAVIALAVVIRGQTKHFDQVVRESARGLRQVALSTGVPVILGVLPALNAAQAFERTGLKHLNKGREWAASAVEMANLRRRLERRPRR